MKYKNTFILTKKMCFFLTIYSVFYEDILGLINCFMSLSLICTIYIREFKKSDSIANANEYFHLKQCNIISDLSGLKKTSPYNLEKGNLLLINAGDTFPTDATILSGVTHVDESHIDGISTYKLKKEGSIVSGGTINITNRVIVSCACAVTDTMYEKIKRSCLSTYKDQINIFSGSKELIFIYAIIAINYISFKYTTDNNFILHTKKILEILFTSSPITYFVRNKIIEKKAYEDLRDNGIFVKRDIISKKFNVQNIFFTKDIITKNKESLTDFFIPKNVYADISSNKTISKKAILLIASAMESRCNVFFAQKIYEYYTNQINSSNPEEELETITASLIFTNVEPKNGADGLFKGSKISFGSPEWSSKKGKIDLSNISEWIFQKSIKDSHIKILLLDNIVIAGFSFLEEKEIKTDLFIKDVKKLGINSKLIKSENLEQYTCNFKNIETINRKELKKSSKNQIIVNSTNSDLPNFKNAFANILVINNNIHRIKINKADVILSNKKSLLSFVKKIIKAGNLKQINLILQGTISLFTIFLFDDRTITNYLIQFFIYTSTTILLFNF